MKKQKSQYEEVAEIAYDIAKKQLSLYRHKNSPHRFTWPQFYSSDQYVSKDLDLINAHFAKRREIRLNMERIGFHEKGRYFTHDESAFLVEFPEGPLAVGKEPVKEIYTFELATGTLHVLSPADCVKDRLCAYYFWNDHQGLAQAVLVAKSQQVDLKELKRWPKAQRNTEKFKEPSYHSSTDESHVERENSRSTCFDLYTFAKGKIIGLRGGSKRMRRCS